MAVDSDFEQSIYRHQQAQLDIPDEDTLFTTFADRVMRRVDQVLRGAGCRWPATPEQIALLTRLKNHQGKQRAVPLEAIAEYLRMTPRQVKELVQDLRLNFGVLIGASRDSTGGGYYLIADHGEVSEATGQMRNQATTMFRVVAAMHAGTHTIDDLLHQLRLDLENANG